MASPTALESTARARVDSMTPEGRLAAFERGEMRRDEAMAWASGYPDEVPLVNGELLWIAATLADVVD